VANVDETRGPVDGVEVGSPDAVGRVDLAAGDIQINAGRRTVELIVENTGDRPIQVGSHFHFFEVNSALAFDRPRAFGMHLDIPSARPPASSPARSAR